MCIMNIEENQYVVYACSYFLSVILIMIIFQETWALQSSVHFHQVTIISCTRQRFLWTARGHDFLMIWPLPRTELFIWQTRRRSGIGDTTDIRSWKERCLEGQLLQPSAQQIARTEKYISYWRIFHKIMI